MPKASTCINVDGFIEIILILSSCYICSWGHKPLELLSHKIVMLISGMWLLHFCAEDFKVNVTFEFLIW